MDSYRLRILEKALRDLQKSAYNDVKLKGANTANINLDEKALKSLINHYKRRK